MVSSATFTENNSPGEYATLMAGTNTPMGQFVREKPIRVTRHSVQTTSANGITANVPVTTTLDFHFISIQDITFSAGDTSGLGATFLSPRDITTLGGATEIHALNRYNQFGQLFGNLEYTGVQFWYQSGLFAPEPTPTIEELLNGPLFQAAGMFEINEPGWADKHDEYIAETYL
jgi:hypothetical protein